jgi:hypothetical protein
MNGSDDRMSAPGIDQRITRTDLIGCLSPNPRIEGDPSLFLVWCECFTTLTLSLNIWVVVSLPSHA